MKISWRYNYQCGYWYQISYGMSQWNRQTITETYYFLVGSYLFIVKMKNYWKYFQTTRRVDHPFVVHWNKRTTRDKRKRRCWEVFATRLLHQNETEVKLLHIQRIAPCYSHILFEYLRLLTSSRFWWKGM